MKFSVTALTLVCLFTGSSASLVSSSVHSTAEADNQMSAIQQMMAKMQARMKNQQKMHEQIKQMSALMDKTNEIMQSNGDDDDDDSDDSDDSDDTDVQLEEKAGA